MATVCALCKVNEDVQNSHIIPEFFYRMVYDPQPRRFRVLSTEPSVPERYEQKGLRERLLCRVCEQRIGRWEDYAKRTFVDGQGVRTTPLEGGMRLHGIDYKTFKLFQLSLLWRMSVSAQDFFAEVDLGPHEEKLRVALLNDDPLQPGDYCCALIVVKVAGAFLKDWMLAPSQGRLGSNRAYWLVINGIFFIYCVGSHPPPAGLAAAAITQRNELVVIDDDARNYPFLNDVLVKLHKAIQDRKKTH
jgi:hypothetical protein